MADLERALVDAARPTEEQVARARLAAGERAARSGAVDVAWAMIDSPVGPLLAAATADGLVTLAFARHRRDEVLDSLARRVSARVVEAPSALREVRDGLDDYFAGRRRTFDLPLDWRLVREGFSRRVLEVTAAVPFGRTLTYTEVAQAAGSPRGSRAAGQALGANPLPIVVPCHRVLRTGGDLGGYAGGLDVKRHLLRLEGRAIDEPLPGT